MKFFLFIITFFVIALLLLGFSVARLFKYIFFSSNKAPKQTSRQTENKSHQQDSTRQEFHDETPSRARKKIFSKDEGEYVDYEEIKE